MARTRTIGLILLAAWLAGPAGAAEGIAWRDDFEAAKREAASTGRLVLLHFSGTFCPPCRAMEQTVFNRADVAQAVEQNYVPVAVDVEKNPGLKQQFGIRPIPADVIVTPEGQVINKSVGAKSAQDYVAALSHYARLARKTTGDRQAAWQPGAGGPKGVGPPLVNQPSMNQSPANQLSPNPGLAAGPPGAYQRGTQQPRSPNGTYDNAKGADWPSHTGPQPNPLAPRVGQQHLHETMLQPPPAPDTGDSRASGADSAIFGQPTNRGAGSTALPWQQQDLPGRTRPDAHGAAPPGPVANPPGTPPAQLPPLGFAGYCPVTIYHQGRWVAGDRRWGVIHEGRLYLFASEQAQEAFRRDFNRYAPVFSGDDIVLYVETGQREPGQVRIGAMQGEKDPRMYLFANEQSYQKFYANPAVYIERLRQRTGGPSGR